MWIQKRGQQHRVYWRNLNRGENDPTTMVEAFDPQVMMSLAHEPALAEVATAFSPWPAH